MNVLWRFSECYPRKKLVEWSWGGGSSGGNTYPTGMVLAGTVTKWVENVCEVSLSCLGLNGE